MTENLQHNLYDINTQILNLESEVNNMKNALENAIATEETQLDLLNDQILKLTRENISLSDILEHVDINIRQNEYISSVHRIHIIKKTLSSLEENLTNLKNIRTTLVPDRLERCKDIIDNMFYTNIEFGNLNDKKVVSSKVKLTYRLFEIKDCYVIYDIEKDTIKIYQDHQNNVLSKYGNITYYLPKMCPLILEAHLDVLENEIGSGPPVKSAY